MKTKIAMTIIAVVALIMSSFQIFESNQDYNPFVKSINNFDLKQHKLYISQATVSCAKCHDCQKDNTTIQDSIKILIYSKKLKTKKTEVLKLEIKNTNQEELDWENDLNPDNLKLK